MTQLFITFIRSASFLLTAVFLIVLCGFVYIGYDAEFDKLTEDCTYKNGHFSWNAHDTWWSWVIRFVIDVILLGYDLMIMPHEPIIASALIAALMIYELDEPISRLFNHQTYVFLTVKDAVLHPTVANKKHTDHLFNLIIILIIIYLVLTGTANV